MRDDLSGYTALTEIHGGEKAADMVQRYLQLVNQSLVGDSRLHERVGDQVVIVSSSAEQLAYTARFLFERVHEQERFLALHAGLHYGPVVQKDMPILALPSIQLPESCRQQRKERCFVPGNSWNSCRPIMHS